MVIVMITVILIRIFSLFISARNERLLKNAGAVEFGKNNSIFLAALHATFYFAAFGEALIKKTNIDIITVFGAGLYIFAICMLFMVIRQLGTQWTVKLILAKDQKINNSFFFRHFRHPNYFLNMIPELVAIVLICKSWITCAVLAPLYFVAMRKRILLEEQVMQEKFAEYKM